MTFYEADYASWLVSCCMHADAVISPHVTWGTMPARSSLSECYTPFPLQFLASQEVVCEETPAIPQPQLAELLASRM